MLGVVNIVGGCFMSLFGFGGYGRSKVNRLIGGRIFMLFIILSGLILFCIIFCLFYFYYFLVCVLMEIFV